MKLRLSEKPPPLGGGVVTSLYCDIEGCSAVGMFPGTDPDVALAWFRNRGWVAIPGTPTLCPDHADLDVNGLTEELR